MCFQTLYAINQTSWKEIDQNLTKKIIFLITFDKNWSEILQIDQHNLNLFMDSYLDHMNAVLDNHASYKQVNKYKLMFKIKPWITPALQKPITVKNPLPIKLISYTYSPTKEHLHARYKDYKNFLSTVLKKSKINCYSHYFDIN